MKTRLMVVFLAALALLIACQSKPTPPAVEELKPSETATLPAADPMATLEQETITPYPAPLDPAVLNPQAYPGPGAAAALYPDTQSGSEVGWVQAITMMLNGEVTSIVIAGTPRVTLLLKDGRQLITEAPSVAEVEDYIKNRCGELCKDIVLEKK